MLVHAHAEAAPELLVDVLQPLALPDRVVDQYDIALPGERLWVTLHDVDDDQRDMLFVAHGKRYEAMLAELRRQTVGVS